VKASFRCVPALVVIIAIIGLPLPAFSQTLDERAWNAVWDRLEQRIPNGNDSNIVHVMEVPIPVTWIDGYEENLRELQRYAGAIPEETFTIDPSRTSRLLHQIYSSVVLDLDLPTGSDKQRKAFLNATATYKQAFTQYNTDLDKFLERWEKRKAELKDMGKPADDLALLRFRGEQAGSLLDSRERVVDASRQVQKLRQVNDYWARAVERLTVEVTGSETRGRDVFTYEGGFAALQGIKNDCADDSDKGWERITFSKDTTSERTRTSSWNGGGSWSAGFFSIGAGARGSSYQHWLNSANDSVRLGFCHLEYVPLGPGGWFVPELLKDVDRGNLRVKQGSSQAGKKMFGPDGSIPRMVKGALVARRILFEANMEASRLEEFKREISGSGGGRIGPFRIRGGGSRSEYSKQTDNEKGGYLVSTAFSVPVIVALITEPTKFDGPAATKQTLTAKP